MRQSFLSYSALPAPGRLHPLFTHRDYISIWRWALADLFPFWRGNIAIETQSHFAFITLGHKLNTQGHEILNFQPKQYMVAPVSQVEYYAYMPTLPDNPRVNLILNKSLGLPYGWPNLPDKSDLEPLHHCKVTSCLQTYPYQNNFSFLNSPSSFLRNFLRLSNLLTTGHMLKETKQMKSLFSWRYNRLPDWISINQLKHRT